MLLGAIGSRWAHQEAGVEGVIDAIADGHRVIVLTSPTGGGKSVMMCDLIDRMIDQNLKVVLYTHRKMLTEQTRKVMLKHGIQFGTRAAGWEADPAFRVQISSIQTEHSRVMKRTRDELHPANLVLVDEGHLLTGKTAQAIYAEHLKREDAVIVLVTATPIDMGNICGIKPKLVVAGVTSQLRACGALVPAHHYGPDEPDVRKIRKQVWEFSENDVRKLIMVEGIFGLVLEAWHRYNPEQKSTILFAPGVAESIWFAEEFRKAGIAAAHIDGNECWVDGEIHKSDKEIRAEILAQSKSGRIKVLCNRFVLREGIDAPWLHVGIFATIFGSLGSYLQAGGRLLRKDENKLYATIIDHGGNWWRHGSLNIDREWHLDWTEAMIQGIREGRLRNHDPREKEPFICPQCKQVLARSQCPCGFKVTKKSRPVVQADGTLKEMTGDIFRPRRLSNRHDADKIWERMYYRAKNGGMTFRQAEALFAAENNWGYPSHQLPLMPRNEIDFYFKVAEVPYERLRPKPPTEAAS